MKQKEKLDLILRNLYQYKYDGFHHSIYQACLDENLQVVHVDEIKTLAHRLDDDGLIYATHMMNDSQAKLTSQGIEYCEEDSYTYSEKSLITNNYNIKVDNSVNVLDSSNVNVVTRSKNVNINQEVKNEIISKIKEFEE